MNCELTLAGGEIYLPFEISPILQFVCSVCPSLRTELDFHWPLVSLEPRNLDGKQQNVDKDNKKAKRIMPVAAEKYKL